jgi:hypothetical protein
VADIALDKRIACNGSLTLLSYKFPDTRVPRRSRYLTAVAVD